MKLKINKSKLLKRTIIILLLLACVGIYVANRVVKKYGFDSLSDFVTVYRNNLDLADKVTPTEIKLLIDDKDYAFLKNRRDVALERGIQINDGENNFVKCKIIEGADTIKGEIRLKGHMTDHLEGDKWSFRVKTKKKQVLGMDRFSLQAPGTRNYAYEWVYHQLLKNENVIHLYYDFIKLQLNDNDLGIYAVEEHFGQHVLERNNRPNGAILRWNPNLYWDGRIDELQKTYLDEDYSSYSSSFVEPYESGTVEKDSILTETYLIGAAMLENFRRGNLITSEVFDIKKLASFHAVIDLVGGHHSLDWSDVKFFYNAESKLIEPVGYESFSVRLSERIAGQRTPNEYNELEADYHNMLFADPIFFEAYIEAVERICDEKYLNNFIGIIQAELDLKLGVLAHEFPYRKFSFSGYFDNINLIRHNLQLPKAFHAFKEAETDSTVTLSLSPVSDYPIELISLVVNEKREFKLSNKFVLPAKARNTYAHYFPVIFHHDGKKLKNLKLKAKIPGSSTLFFIEVFDLPSYLRKSSDSKEVSNTINIETYGIVALNDSVSYFNQKRILVDDEIIFHEKNHTLKIFPGQELVFGKNGKIVTYGTIEMLGREGDDEEGIIVRADPTRNEDDFILEIENGNLKCANVNFNNFNNGILANNSHLSFTDCAIAVIEGEFLSTHESNIIITRSYTGSMNSLGTFNQSNLKIVEFTCLNGDKFLNANGSQINVMKSSFEKFNIFSELNFNSNLRIWQTNISVNEAIVVLNNASDFKAYGGEFSSNNLGFKVDLSTYLPGESSYDLYRPSSTAIKVMENKVVI